MARFDVERMPVYTLARELNRACVQLCRRLTRRDLVDQLARAAASVPFNIAEGAGEFKPKEKARFYRMARRSATECAGIFDAIVDCGQLPEAEVAAARLLAARATGQLVSLGKAVEARSRKPRKGGAE